jgi:hypothetical protein
MPLTDTFLKTVKYTRTDNKPQREYDTDGLYLEITPKGVKKWQMKYKRPITGKENRLSFGIYPEVTLKEARLKRDTARKLLNLVIRFFQHTSKSEKLTEHTTQNQESLYLSLPLFITRSRQDKPSDTKYSDTTASTLFHRLRNWIYLKK